MYTNKERQDDIEVGDAFISLGFSLCPLNLPTCRGWSGPTAVRRAAPKKVMQHKTVDMRC